MFRWENFSFGKCGTVALKMDPVGGTYFKNIFIEVMVAGMTLSKRRGKGNADVQGKNLDTRVLGILSTAV